MITFTEDCFTGIEAIDEKRIAFFELLTSETEKEENGNERARVMKLAERLHLFADGCFEAEEEYLSRTKDAEYGNQKREHDEFLLKISNIGADFTDATDFGAYYKELLRFMIRWFYHHIVCSDTLIGRFKERTVSMADMDVLTEEEEKVLKQLEEKNEVSGENPFKFTRKYFTGIDFVDEEHKVLFEIIEQAHDAIHNDFLYDKYDQITHILGELLEYTKTHFKDEEEYMEKIGYDGLALQKKAHNAFVKKIEGINLEDVDDNQDEYLESILAFLVNWLGNHIIKLDQLIPNVQV